MHAIFSVHPSAVGFLSLGPEVSASGPISLASYIRPRASSPQDTISPFKPITGLHRQLGGPFQQARVDT
jgi:hypothetical protein